MRKLRNVVMLPTKTISSLSNMLSKGYETGKWYWDRLADGQFPEVIEPHHLYFTAPSIGEDSVNGEEIKEGDKFVRGISPKFIYTCSKIDSRDIWDGENSFDKKECQKVIATTDPDLWFKKSGYTALMELVSVSDGLPKIPIDFIEAFVKQQGIKQVSIEYEMYDNPAFNRNKGVNLHNPTYLTRPLLNNNGAVKVFPVEEKKYTFEDLKLVRDMAVNSMLIKSQMSAITSSFLDWFNKQYQK